MNCCLALTKKQGDIMTYKSFDDLKPEVREAIKSKPIRDRKYLDSFQGGVCMFHKAFGEHESTCGHHLLHGVQRGQRKASDCFVISLCWICHRQIHLNEKEFIEKKELKDDIREMAFCRYKEWKKRNAK